MTERLAKISHQKTEADKAVDTFVWKRDELKAYITEELDDLIHKLAQSDSGASPWVISSLLHTRNKVNDQLNEMCKPIESIIRTLMSTRYAEVSEIQQHFGAMYGSDLDSSMPALHLHGGSVPITPSGSSQAPNVMSPFMPANVVVRTSKTKNTSTRKAKPASAATATASDGEGTTDDDVADDESEIELLEEDLLASIQSEDELGDK